MTLRLIASLALLAPIGAGAAETVLQSGPQRIALVELFTSEGCSSCPPAERWLAAHRSDPGLWREFVPVSWHVTYWDNLGWPDRLAQRGFTDRQYAYASAWRRDNVYTPCFVRDGREWQAGEIHAATGAAGVLRVQYDPAAGEARVKFEPATTSVADLDVEAVLLGGGLVSAVRAGENSGRTLEHEFAALTTARAALTHDAEAFRATLHLTVAGTPAAPRHALAVWVTRHGDLTPLQAVGGWINP